MITAILIFTSLFIYGLTIGTPQIVGQLIMGANLSGNSQLKPITASTQLIKGPVSSVTRVLSKVQQKK